MLEAARATASHPIKISKLWFEYNKEELMKRISKRNEILHKTRNEVLNEEELEKRKRELRRKQKYIYNQTRIAVERWAEDHAEKYIT